MISSSSIPKQISKGGKMPKGLGTYGSKIGRPPKKKRLYKKGGPVAGRPAKKEKESAREKAIRLGGQKGRFSKFIGKQMTGKASPHTDRDESPIGKLIREVRKYEKLMQKVPRRIGKAAKKKKG